MKTTAPKAVRKSKPRKESPQGLKSRALRISEKLHAVYGDRGTALRFKTPFQLLVSTVLSAQSTDEQVNRVTPRLFEKFPTAEKLAKAGPETVEELIHSTGYFRQKTRSILALSQAIVERFGGKIPESMEDLTSLPGVGRKTANCVRAEAFGHPGIIVDTHFRRVTQRLGLVDTDDPTKIEFRIAELLPESHWSNFSNSMIWHGRRICHARKPECPPCPVLDDCPFGREFVKKIE